MSVKSIDILVDLDGVLADIETAFLEIWRGLYPDRPYILIPERDTFYLQEQYARFDESYAKDVTDIILTPGFFRDLPPILGGKEALEAIQARGHRITICTAPMPGHESCLQEKFDWVRQHLGDDLAHNMVIAYDKTRIKGHLLIDDRPEIKGVLHAEWEHVMFDAPYNRDAKRRFRFSTWREIAAVFDRDRPTT